MSWAEDIGGAFGGAFQIHDHVVKNQQQYKTTAHQTQGYCLTYEKGQRLWREHRHDGKAQSVLDNHWKYSLAECWNSFADGYDDAKNADGESGRGPRKLI